jgi:beta-galactosidase GanA
MVRIAGIPRGLAALCCLLLAWPCGAEVPRLETQGSAVHLIVHGAPMLILGGELGNSSASSARYMAPHWPLLKRMHLNTVLAPISWELIEPMEGVFRWDSVDALITAARANDLKLVLLWFGAWKNSMSTYAPAWVKRDQQRFPRALLPNGQALDILSAFSATTRDADARAFATLLRHIKDVDAEQNTVLMMQVENEIGMLPGAREYGAAANRLFQGPVPGAVIRQLAGQQHHGQSRLHQLWMEHGARAQGNWSELFGDGDAAAESFTAWHYAQYVEAVVKAGKAAYPLPMYVNAALNRTNKTPGEYPSGGPLPHLFELWKAGAPSVDLLAPDIYFPSFVDWATLYSRPDNPLFIPEANNADRAEVLANALYAFGKLGAIGFSPFSIESLDQRQPNLIADSYALLEQLSPFILSAQGTLRMSAFRPRVLEDGTVVDAPVTEVIGDFRFTVSFIDTQSAQGDQNIAAHGGVIIQTAAEDYIVAGQGIIVTFTPVGDGLGAAGIDSDWEGTFDARGTWIPGRLLNGDQTHQGRHLRLPPDEFQIQRVRLYEYH